jgi:hypothetical protein
MRLADSLLTMHEQSCVSCFMPIRFSDQLLTLTANFYKYSPSSTSVQIDIQPSTTARYEVLCMHLRIDYDHMARVTWPSAGQFGSTDERVAVGGGRTGVGTNQNAGKYMEPVI